MIQCINYRRNNSVLRCHFLFLTVGIGHARRLVMKTVLLALILFITNTLAVAAPIVGSLQKGKADDYIYLDGQSKRFLIRSAPAEALLALEGMGTGDYIIANGIVNEKNHFVEIFALDYVGLKKLLGVWYNKNSVMDFKSYSALSVYPFCSATCDKKLAARTELRYSMAPYKGNEWAIFLSDSYATVFATIEIDKDTARMSLYDGETGNVSDTLFLTRWRK